MSSAHPVARSGEASGPSGPRASFGVRCLAFLIDLVILGAAHALLGFTLGTTVGVATGALLSIAYFAYLEAQPAGQTWGKRLLGIRVIDFNNGGSLELSTALVRSAVHYISVAACLVGCIWALFNKENQAWHDLASQTVVVPVSAYPVPA
jgi:uncharacterized RDD family membrane protein YckC